jgi:hypothetical protein
MSGAPAILRDMSETPDDSPQPPTPSILLVHPPALRLRGKRGASLDVLISNPPPATRLIGLAWYDQLVLDTLLGGADEPDAGGEALTVFGAPATMYRCVCDPLPHVHARDPL